MKTTFVVIIMSAFLFSFLEVTHAERYIVVNGQRLSLPAIQYLERIHCGPVPNGRYWINMLTGVWGYEGNSHSQGHVQDNCYSPQRRPSLSERGMLFSPRDWIR